MHIKSVALTVAGASALVQANSYGGLYARDASEDQLFARDSALLERDLIDSTLVDRDLHDPLVYKRDLESLATLAKRDGSYDGIIKIYSRAADAKRGVRDCRDLAYITNPCD